MISNTVEYALRALSSLTSLAPGEAIVGHDLAERTEIPGHYLAKIMARLGGAGIVEATRGIGGGYRLSRPPKEVQLLEIVELLDPRSIQPGCLLAHRRECSETDPCLAHDRWTVVKDAFIGFLQNTTLAELSPSTGTQLGELSTNPEEERNP